MQETNEQQNPQKVIHKPGYIQIDDCVFEAKAGQKITFSAELEKSSGKKKT